MARLFQQAGSVMLPLAYRSYEVFMHKQEVEEDTHTFRPNLCLVRSDYSWAAFSRAISGGAGQKTSALCFSGFSCSFVYSS